MEWRTLELRQSSLSDCAEQDLDVDDVGALCAAHALVDQGEAEILAVGEG